MFILKWQKIITRVISVAYSYVFKTYLVQQISRSPRTAVVNVYLCVQCVFQLSMVIKKNYEN